MTPSDAEAKPVSQSDSTVKTEASSKAEPSSAQDPEREAYIRLSKSLKELINKKLSIDNELDDIEDRIYVEEGAYLQDASAGNVVKGFDQYIKSNQTRRKSMLVEQDRIFSQGSTSFDAEA